MHCREPLSLYSRKTLSLYCGGSLSLEGSCSQRGPRETPPAPPRGPWRGAPPAYQMHPAPAPAPRPPHCPTHGPVLAPAPAPVLVAVRGPHPLCDPGGHCLAQGQTAGLPLLAPRPRGPGGQSGEPSPPIAAQHEKRERKGEKGTKGQQKGTSVFRHNTTRISRMLARPLTTPCILSIHPLHASPVFLPQPLKPLQSIPYTPPQCASNKLPPPGPLCPLLPLQLTPVP